MPLCCNNGLPCLRGMVWWKTRCANIAPERMVYELMINGMLLKNSPWVYNSSLLGTILLPPPARRHIRRGNGVKVVCRGAATLGGAGCAHVSAHGASEGSAKARKTMIRQFPTIHFLWCFSALFIAIATETAPPELCRLTFGPPTTHPEGSQPR